MKKLLVCLVLLVFVVTAVSAIDLSMVRSVNRAVKPYVEQWGEYNYYCLFCHPWYGCSVGFSWRDEQGVALHYVIFAYVDDEWAVYEASEELIQLIPGTS